MLDLHTALAPSQAARQLDISRERVGQLVRAGKLEAVKTALGYLVSREAVERMRIERGANLTDTAPEAVTV